jgi:hypothetical protein
MAEEPCEYPLFGLGANSPNTPGILVALRSSHHPPAPLMMQTDAHDGQGHETYICLTYGIPANNRSSEHGFIRFEGAGTFPCGMVSLLNPGTSEQAPRYLPPDRRTLRRAASR